jgi:tRNA (mo5U34)-methyltransferase
VEQMPNNWRFKIRLRDGSVTPGRIEASETSKLIDKIDMQGKEVLDVGAWDGHFGVISLQKGAREVTCLDIVIRPTIKFIKAHFQFEHMHLVKGSIYDFNPHRQYDVVLFYGVFYHLSDPVQALTNCFRLSREIVAVEGVMHKDDLPSMILLAPNEIAPGDNSNIFSLSTSMITKLARTCGFEPIFEQGGTADPRSQLGRRGAMVFIRTHLDEKKYADWSFPIAPIKLDKC